MMTSGSNQRFLNDLANSGSRNTMLPVDINDMNNRRIVNYSGSEEEYRANNSIERDSKRSLSDEAYVSMSMSSTSSNQTNRDASLKNFK